MKNFSLFMVLILSASCAVMKTKVEKDIERTIASVGPNQLKIDEMDGSYFVTVNIEVNQMRKGDNTFDIHAPYFLFDRFKSHLIYDIYVNSNDIRCVNHGSYQEMTKNVQYRSYGKLTQNVLNCFYEGPEIKKLVSVTYVFPKLEYIPFEEANSFIRPVNGKKRDVYRLKRFIKEQNRKNFFDDRVLFNLFAKKKTVSLSTSGPAKNAFRIKLSQNEAIKISNLRGKLITLDKKIISHLGVESGDLDQVNDYEFICHVKKKNNHKTEVLRFRWASEFELDDAKELKCFIHTKNIAAGDLEKISGEIKFDIAVVNFEQLNDQILTHLENPQDRLNTYIDYLNDSNLAKAKESAQLTIDLQMQKPQPVELVNVSFPYTIEKEFQIEQMSISHFPKIVKQTRNEENYYFLGYDVYANPKLIDPDNALHMSSGSIYLGQIHTDKLVDKTNNYSSFAFSKNICGRVYGQYFLERFVELNNFSEDGAKISDQWEEYLRLMDELEKENCKSPDDLSEIISLSINRIGLKKCRVDSDRDAIEGVYRLIGSEQKEKDFENYKFYKKVVPLNKPQTLEAQKNHGIHKNCKKMSEQEVFELFK